MAAEPEGHPIVSGLVALVGVGMVVGLLISAGALTATSILGLDGGNDNAGASGQQSMYLPKPSPTDPETGPLVTLQPGETPTSTDTAAPPPPQFTISLSAAQTEVGQMGEIYLTGVYPGGEGAIVQVQRLESGQWEDFATVDAVVTNETFSTYVQTAQTGVNKFRVRDTDSDQVSNQVKVRVR